MRILTAVLLLCAAIASQGVIIKGEDRVKLVTQSFEFRGDPKGGELSGSGMEFKIRYKLFQHWGEPVMSFVPYYKLGSVLTLRGRNGVTVRFELTYAGGVQYKVEPDAKSGGVITVPKRIFDKLSLWRYKAKLRFMAGLMGRDMNEFIMLDDEGLLAPQAQWGMDFPGSPSWDDVFLGRKAAAAKEVWKQMATLMPHGGPTPDLQLEELAVDTVDFRHEIRRYLPKAFYPLSGRPMDEQARALIDAVIVKLRETKGRQIVRSLLRRRGITDKFFDRFGDRLDASLVTEWQQVRQSIELAPQISKKVKEVADKLASGTASTADELQARQFLATGAIKMGLITGGVWKDLGRAAVGFERSLNRRSENQSEPQSPNAKLSIGELYIVAVSCTEHCIERRNGRYSLRRERHSDASFSRMMTFRYAIEKRPDRSVYKNPLHWPELEQILSGWQLAKIDRWQSRYRGTRDRPEGPKGKGSLFMFYFADRDHARLFRNNPARVWQPEPVPSAVTK